MNDTFNFFLDRIFSFCYEQYNFLEVRFAQGGTRRDPYQAGAEGASLRTELISQVQRQGQGKKMSLLFFLENPDTLLDPEMRGSDQWRATSQRRHSSTEGTMPIK